MPTRIELPPADDLAAMVRATSLAVVADDHGCSTETIYRALRDAGYGQGGNPAQRHDTSDPQAPEFADQPWAEAALCMQVDPEIFFPEKGGSTKEAKKVCLSCEVREECLKWALDTDQRFGLWGGHSERERRKLKKEQPVLAATGTDGPSYDAVDQAVDAPVDEQPVPSYGVPSTTATGHRPIPLATQVGIRPAHAPKPARPTGLDWDKHRAPDAPAPAVPAPGTTRCRWCREPSTDVVDDLCPDCRAEAEQQFTVPTAPAAPVAIPAPLPIPRAPRAEEPTTRDIQPEDIPADVTPAALRPDELLDQLIDELAGVRARFTTDLARIETALDTVRQALTPTDTPAPVAASPSTPETATGPTSTTPTAGLDSLRPARRRRRPPSTFDLAVAKRLYLEEQLTCPQIADRLGSTVATVRRHLKAAGVPMRDDRARNSGRNAKTIDDYDPTLVAEIKRLYVDEQQTTVQVAEQIGHTPKLVTTILERAGIPRRPPASTSGRKGRDVKLDDTKRAEICRRYEAGESSVALATAYDVAPPTVLGLLRRRGIPIRNQGGSRVKAAS